MSDRPHHEIPTGDKPTIESGRLSGGMPSKKALILGLLLIVLTIGYLVYRIMSALEPPDFTS